MTNSLRNLVIEYAKQQYNTTEEYLWRDTPRACVLRCSKTHKWYGIIMEVGKSILGLDGEGKIDILNVKCSPAMLGDLINECGFLPAYHMNKQNWISILLDGSVPINKIEFLISLSYDMVK